MSATTRHLINRQRRLAATATTAAPRTAPAARTAAAPRTTAPSRTREPALPKARDRTPAEPAGARTRTRSRRLRIRIPFPHGVPLVAVLTLLTVLFGCFAAWAAGKASALHDPTASGNTALTDTARTSEVKGTVAQAVNAVFSYDYADPARTDDAAKLVLTGQAVQQYATMIAEVKKQAPAQKLVLTTTVTDTGVEMIDGDRARVLVFADQSNTATAASATSAGTTYAAAMFAVDVVRQDGTWKIATIDTFG